MTESSSVKTPDRSYVDYLQDVVGGGDEEDSKRLDISGSSAGDLLAAPITTTPYNGCGIISPQLTEARSFVNGLLSPFSPLLKQQDQRNEFLQYVSLQPCRKVSIVVRVLPVEQNNDEEQRCVFPHIKNEQNPVVRKPKAPRDMVVVNPSAFGKFIPSQVTMETARLVAQVAHISSEDWARLYEFHHVMWSTPGDDENQAADQFSTMDSLGRAVAQDALIEHQSSLVISMGQTSSCIGMKDGLWPKIVSHCQALMEEKSVCTLTMVEILEDKDSFRDLLNRKNKDVSIRHVDMKGAQLQGLTEVPIDSMPALSESLLKRRKVNTTVVATLSLWENAVSHELNKAPNAQITCVELAPASKLEDQQKPGNDVVHRKSAVSLGQALRQLLLHASVGTEPAISYRETTLTKILQRSLESSKIVLVASVSQLSKDYESTVVTLNYLRRLLVQPGNTASSPFKSNSFEEDSEKQNVESTTTPSKLQEYADDQYLLEKIVADPRQRLAKVFKMSPARKSAAPLEKAPSQDDYQPVDYMEGLDYQPEEQPWQSPPALSTQIDKEDPLNYHEKKLEALQDEQWQRLEIAETTSQESEQEWRYQDANSSSLQEEEGINDHALLPHEEGDDQQGHGEDGDYDYEWHAQGNVNEHGSHPDEQTTQHEDWHAEKEETHQQWGRDQGSDVNENGGNEKKKLARSGAQRKKGTTRSGLN